MFALSSRSRFHPFHPLLQVCAAHAPRPTPPPLGDSNHHHQPTPRRGCSNPPPPPPPAPTVVCGRCVTGGRTTLEPGPLAHQLAHYQSGRTMQYHRTTLFATSCALITPNPRRNHTGPLSESLVPAQVKRRKDAIVCKLGGMVGSLLHGTLARVPGPGGEKEEEKKEEEGEGRNRKIDLIVKNCGVLSVRVHAYCIQSHRAY